MKNLVPNKINIDEKSCKNILIYYIGCVMVKNLDYVKINSVNLLHIIMDKINRYNKESNGNRYKSKDTLKRYKELWNKIRDSLDQ